MSETFIFIVSKSRINPSGHYMAGDQEIGHINLKRIMNSTTNSFFDRMIP